ncbi:unnamed protein product [Rhizoctonia solani]|uniref:Uncharacterized protein n=1 Tax=Rhizoctonia solani TaxID=456999 RepID=A0A8H3DXL5_9AGAM|nr:unnamed protein product [Rhizoctonia solani]
MPARRFASPTSPSLRIDSTGRERSLDLKVESLPAGGPNEPRDWPPVPSPTRPAHTTAARSLPPLAALPSRVAYYPHGPNVRPPDPDSTTSAQLSERSEDAEKATGGDSRTRGERDGLRRRWVNPTRTTEARLCIPSHSSPSIRSPDPARAFKTPLTSRERATGWFGNSRRTRRNDGPNLKV